MPKSRLGLEIDLDFSQWPRSLDLDTPPVLGDHKTTRTTSINGAPAKLVTARVLRRTVAGDRTGYLSGVHFASVPLRTPSLLSDQGLNLVAWCDEPEGCAEASTIFESLVFY